MLPRAPFGRTGHESTRVIFGAAALGTMRQERADAVLAQVRAAGINHLDTAASYGDAELRMAPFLAEHRDEVFLATKTGERAGPAARAELERSLQRLGVDHVDLIQLHNLVEADEWQTAHGPGGALDGLARARDEGLAGAIGVTGHGLRIAEMHLRSLERFDFASVLFPWNPVLARDDGYARDVERLRERCVERGVGVQIIKSVARRRWPADAPGPRLSWYEPLPVGSALDRAVRFVLAEADLFLNTSSDARLLDAIVTAASGPLVAPGTAELDADIAGLGVTALFDGAALERV